MPESNDDALTTICPTCHAAVKTKKYATHVISGCHQRSSSSSTEPRVLFTEYEQERQRDGKLTAIKPAGAIKSLVSVSDEFIPRGSRSKWIVCSRCSEEVKAGYLQNHECYPDRIYVTQLPRLGIRVPDFVEQIAELLRTWPGSSARQLAWSLTSRYGKTISKSIVNSVLYSFRNRRFHRLPEGDGFDDEWNPPSWYYGTS